MWHFQVGEGFLYEDIFQVLKFVRFVNINICIMFAEYTIIYKMSHVTCIICERAEQILISYFTVSILNAITKRALNKGLFSA